MLSLDKLPRILAWLLSLSPFFMLGCGSGEANSDKPTTGGNSTVAAPAPNPAGKKILNDLGMSELQIPADVLEKRVKAVMSGSDEKKIVPEEDLYRRPEQWIKPDELPYEFWEVHYMGNREVGYAHQRVGPSAVGSAGIYRIEADTYKQVKLAGKQLEQTIRVMTIEEVDGALRTIEAEVSQGDLKTKIEGNVVLGSLRLRIVQDGKTIGKELTWGDNIGGPFADIQTLRGRPMKPGENRKFVWLDPVTGTLLKYEYQAKDYMMTPLIDGQQHRLLEVMVRAHNSERGIESLIWINDRGEPLKSYNPQTDIRSFRCDRSLAERVRDAGLCESFDSIAVPLSEPILDADNAGYIDFHVTSITGELRRPIAARTNQSVKIPTSLSNVVRVHAMDEATRMPEGVTPELNIGPSFKKASPVLETDDRFVKKLAKDFVDDESLGKSKLERLRRGVFDWVKNKTFQPFTPKMSTAAEAARSQAGDSTEHALLLAAVVRSLNVPSRVVAGLVYNRDDKSPAMVYHCWTEVYLRDHWVSIDASREESRTDATYLRLVDSDMADFNPYVVMLPVLSIIPDLAIKRVQEKPAETSN
jgi:hypothetical protein